MGDPVDRFGEHTVALTDVRDAESGEYIHTYTGTLADTDEPVRIHTLAPPLADIDAAVEAFTRVSDQWYNASANANVRTVRARDTTPRPWIAVPDDGAETLAAARPDLAPGAIGSIITETADALRTLGLYNTVHGHLSPEDVHVTDASGDPAALTAEVGGFGLEAAIQAAVGEHEPTAYTAPELVGDSDQRTERTDVYGLGAVAYFALTGQPPVTGTDVEAAIRDSPGAPPSAYVDGISDALDDVVMQALATRPADRHDSPYAFYRAFTTVFDPADFTDAEETDAGPDTGPDEETSTADQTDDEPSETDAEESSDNADSGVARRAALSVLGLGAIGGAGAFLLRTNLFGFGSPDQPASAPEQSPAATLTPTPVQSRTPVQTPIENDIDPTRQANIAPDDGDSDDRFGVSTAVSSDGTTALVGASSDEDPNGGRAAGSAYVFERSGGVWSQQAKLAADDGGRLDNFGRSVALSGDGTTAIIGAYTEEDPSGHSAGAIYIFERTEGSWSQQAKLAAADGDSSDYLGWAVAVSPDGSTVLAGARSDEDPNGENAGSAYIFETDGDSWSQLAKLVAADGEMIDYFGGSVAVSDDGRTALIGAAADGNANGERAGATYVFSATASGWRQQAKLTAGDGARGDSFGKSVALASDGTTAIVGAYTDGTPDGEQTGSAYVFEDTADGWGQQAKLTADDADSDDFLGGAVALTSDGTTVIVGAYNDEDPRGEGAGSAYAFGRTSDGWNQQAKLSADVEGRAYFGWSVAVSGDASTALIGASYDGNPNGSDAGAAYVFTL